MNFSAWSIRNPVPAILLFVVLTFLGLSALNELGKESFPNVDLPTITVSASLEGASPDQLETEVARKLENQIATLGDIENIRTTITEGNVSITVQFELEKDSEEALNLVRNAVDSTRSDLPAALRPPIVSKVTTTPYPVLTFVVTADNMDETELSWFIDNELEKALLSTPGVGKFSRVGGVDREIQVNLDTNAMYGLGVSAADISRQIKSVQQDASGGRGDLGNSVQSFRTMGALHHVNEIAALEIPLSNGQHIQLNQVANVKDGIAERSSLALHNDKTVMLVEVYRLRGYSQVTLAKDIRDRLESFRKLHPTVKIEEAFDSVKNVEENFTGSMQLMYEGALLAVIVVWWFLRDWRATFISAVALPLSVIPTFAVMQYMGFSLNILSLLALALVIGILVDDAIVEIENIVRHLRMGKKPFQAAMEAADEIGFAVIATTFTLVAIFLPTAFMGGVIGKYFKQFGITAAVAILGSLVVARLLTPMMSAYLLKPHDEGEEKTSPLMQSYLRSVEWSLSHYAFNTPLISLKLFNKHFKIPKLNFLIGHRHLILVLFFAFSVVSGFVLPKLLPKGFVPSADISQTKVIIEMQPGTPLPTTAATAKKAIKLLQQNKDVKDVYAIVGQSQGGGGGPHRGAVTNDVRNATLNILLTDRTDRPYKQASIEAELRKLLKDLPAARVSVGSGETGERLLLTIASDDVLALNKASEAIQAQLSTINGLGNIVSSASLQRPEIQILPDFDKAAELGVTVAAIAEVIRVATAGDFSTAVPKLNLPQRQIPINVRLEPALRNSLAAIAQLQIPGRNGMVSLETVADISLNSGSQKIARFDRLRNVTFDIELSGRLIGDVLKEVNQLPSLQNLPPSVQRIQSGDAKRMGELFGRFGSAMLIGILCIYVVLVLLFADFLQPVTILGALPLSLGGAFLALALTNNSFSMPSVIGLLMLMGVVTKNSILLVEYTIMARKERALSRFNAIIDGCQKRARPIVMTTIAMAAGMMPIALGWGADPSFRSPMAITVIGGLVTSTILSLIVIPVLYTYVDDLLRVLRALPQIYRYLVITFLR